MPFHLFYISEHIRGTKHICNQNIIVIALVVISDFLAKCLFGFSQGMIFRRAEKKMLIGDFQIIISRVHPFFINKCREFEI